MRARPAQWQSRNKQKGKARYRRVETTGRRTLCPDSLAINTAPELSCVCQTR
ncbi:hypothetical protein C4D60_Mb06t04140 [Musa balbisiana]|uniref:Uncharacterized protein n=1 Tax=Musa balbisiana TaxID=52838 RepID=A0A4S8IKI9_MUSBA|nr:hypothetical protein C4D60_Mb06t04140 [Musa balbisiana]